MWIRNTQIKPQQSPFQPSSNCLTLALYFYSSLRARQLPRNMHTRLKLSINGVYKQMLPPCAEWWGKKDNQATTRIVQARCFSLFGHSARMPDVTKILAASTMENLRRPSGRHWCMKTIQQDLKFNNLPEWSKWCGTESSTLETDVYGWCYALLVVHVSKDQLSVTEKHIKLLIYIVN